jgi:hypothetical protein
LKSFVLPSLSLSAAVVVTSFNQHKSNIIRIFERSSRFAGNHPIPAAVEEVKPGPVFKNVDGGVRSAATNDKSPGATVAEGMPIHEPIVDGIGSGKGTIANNDATVLHKRQDVLKRHRRWMVELPGA